METAIPLFGFVHLTILAATPLLALLFTAIERRLPEGSSAARLSLAVLLFTSSAMYYGYLVANGQLTYPEHIPLELCDASLILVIIVLLTRHKFAFDLAYYWALAGATMAMLTPNLPQGSSTYLVAQFFIDHGLIIAGVLYLLWTRQARPRKGSALRALVVLNLYAAFVGSFDGIYKTNYMFLLHKPPTITLLTYLGPWPWYILSVEVVGLFLFSLLYWPYRERAMETAFEEV